MLNNVPLVRNVSSLS